MGGVVIAHDMHAQFGRNLGIDCGQELLELSRPVAAMGGVGHGAVSDVGRGEQVCCAVPEVVVGVFAGHARHHLAALAATAPQPGSDP